MVWSVKSLKLFFMGFALVNLFAVQSLAEFSSCQGRGTQNDLSLVLAIDVSRSIDPVEFELQRSGYENAFKNPQVVEILAEQQCVAIGVVLWSETAKAFFDLRLMKSESDLNSLVTFFKSLKNQTGPSGHRVATFARSGNSIKSAGTFIGEGLLRAREMLSRSSLTSLRKVIDVSGDGPNIHAKERDRNRLGRVNSLKENVALAQSQEITINGLAIEDMDYMGGPQKKILEDRGYSSLTEYYNAEVKTRYGFVETATSFDTFAETIVRKLVREMSPAIM